jgi:hypothetical protein
MDSEKRFIIKAKKYQLVGRQNKVYCIYDREARKDFAFLPDRDNALLLATQMNGAHELNQMRARKGELSN